MSIELTEEQRMLRDTLRRVGKEKLERLTIEMDRADRFDYESFQLLKDGDRGRQGVDLSDCFAV